MQTHDTISMFAVRVARPYMLEDYGRVVFELPAAWARRPRELSSHIRVVSRVGTSVGTYSFIYSTCGQFSRPGSRLVVGTLILDWCYEQCYHVTCVTGQNI